MASPQEFAQQYGPLAASVGKNLGVAPEILLGQWGLETGWGRSVIPGTNNLGNIKDFSGSGVGATDNMTGSRDKYRAYDTADAFGQDFAGLIGRKYRGAMGVGNDAQKWAEALKAGGYAEDPDYVRKVVAATDLVRKSGGIGDRIAAALLPSAKAAEAPQAGLSTKIEKARAAGYSDDEIMQHLSQSAGFSEKLKKAREAGYTDAEIFQHLGLSAPQAVPNTSTSAGPDGVMRVEMAHEEPKEATLAQQIQGSMPGRFIQGGRDILDAGAQMLANAVPESVADALNTGVRAVNDLPVIGPVTKALGMTPASAEELNQQISQNEQQYQAARQAVGDTGFDTARLAGNVLATAPLAAVSAPAAAASIPARIAAAGGAGALFGGLQPVTEGDYASNKLQQMALGAAVSGGLSGVGNSLARLVSPKASTNPQVQRLLDEGVTPTPGQIMGGTARTAEDRAMSVPIVGDAIRSARKRGIEELNRAALNRAMAPLGGKVNNVGREGMREVGDAISSAYDDLLPKLSFRADGQFARDLGRLQQMAQAMPPAQAQQFENIVRSQVASRMTPQGGATGQAYKEIEGEIGRLARSYLSSANAGERQLGTALAELQNSLRSALSRANPGSAKELAKINEAYANFVRLQRAAGMVGADDGIFTPAQLSSAVRASDKSMRKGKYARGEALMQDLSDAGRSVMSGTIPNSGTADRLMLSAGALGTGLYNPLIPAGLMAASIPYFGGVNRLAAAALARRPGFAPQIAEGVRSVIPAAGVVATQMMNPALQQ